MQIGPLNISLSEKTQEEPKKTVNTAELGGSGTTVYNGMISDEEFNSKLDTEYGMGGLDVFDKMRRSDPIVKQSLLIVKLPIIQALWTVEEAKEEPGSEEHKQLIEEALFDRMDRSFPNIVREILTYLDFGFSVFEKVFKVEDGKIYLKKLAMRKQKSIMKFETENHQFGITQQLTSPTYKQVSIPGEKLAIFTNDKEGDNYRGISILRSAYKPYYFKEVFEKVDAIAFERQGVGIPVFTMPSSPKPADVEKAKAIGKNLRANEKAYVMLPKGWELEILDMKGGSSQDATDKIKAKNREILSNVLAQFLDLGSGSTGSRALSDDHSDSFYQAEQSHAESIAEVFNDQIIPQLINLNFNGVTKYPKLKVSNVKKINIDRFATAISGLISANALSVDTEIEDFLRNVLGLPAMSEELRKIKEMASLVVKDKKPETPPAKNPEDPKPTDKNKMGDNPEAPAKNPAPNKMSEQLKSLEMQEKQICGCGRFSEDEYFRAFTEPEKRIDLDAINKNLDKLEDRFSAELKQITSAELDQLLAKIKIAIMSGDIRRIEQLLSEFKFDLYTLLFRQSKEAFEYGKKTVSENLRVPLIPTTDEQNELLSTKISALADKMSNDIVSQVKLNAIESVQLKTDIDQAVKSIRTQADKMVARSTDLASSNVLMGSFNQGRKAVQDEFSERIYGLQRSEILDKKICNYCLSVDGRIVTVDDPIAIFNQFHFRCRGMWVEILLAEKDKPPIGGFPSDLRARAGLLTDFQQLKNPQPLEGSLADEFVKSGKSVALK